MHTRRITFYLGSTGLPSWLLKSIHQQVKPSHSDVSLIKVQTLQQVNVKDYLNVLTLAFHPFELCQLVLSSEDQNLLEQQVVGLKTHLQQECLVLDSDTIQSTRKISNLGLFNAQVFDIERELASFLKLYSLICRSGDPQLAEKKFCLRWIAKFAQSDSPEQLEQELYRREALSSTGMQSGLALPHVMSDTVSTPQIMILTSPVAIDWLSPFGPVTHIIALLLPINANKETLMAVRHLATPFIKPEVNEFICQHYTPLELQAIVSCLMKLEH